MTPPPAPMQGSSSSTPSSGNRESVLKNDLMDKIRQAAEKKVAQGQPDKIPQGVKESLRIDPAPPPPKPAPLQSAPKSAESTPSTIPALPKRPTEDKNGPLGLAGLLDPPATPPKAPDAPAATPEAKSEEYTVANALADAQAQLDNPHTGSRNRKLAEKMLETNRAYQESLGKLQEREKAVKDLETKLAEKATLAELPEDVKKKVELAQMYERRYELESSPDVKEKFDNVIDGHQGAIYDGLMKLGMPKDIIDTMKANGGFDGWMQSAPQAYQLLKEQIDNAPNAAAINQFLTGHLSSIYSRRLERKSYIDAESARAGEKIKEHEQSVKKEREQSLTSSLDRQKKNQQLLAALKTQHPALQRREIPKDADDATRMTFQREHDFQQNMETLFQRGLEGDPKAQEVIAQSALDSVILRIELQRANHYIQQIETAYQGLTAASPKPPAHVQRVNEDVREPPKQDKQFSLTPDQVKFGGTSDSLLDPLKARAREISANRQ